MSKLLSRANAPDAEGCIQRITAESAGWQHVGFESYLLSPGQRLARQSMDKETCLVVVGGKANICAGEHQWRDLGEREGPFAGQPPVSVYLPPGQPFEVEALTELELAVCRAPAEGVKPVQLIRPEACRYTTRGTGTNTRHVCNILFDDSIAERLLVCEVLTPDGHWSSYPPHKHDTADGERETQLEETYYHRIDPPQGFAFQRVYTDDRRLDETMSVENHDVVMVPEGYHPVGAAHGYQLYYLNVMAGPERRWVFNNDPAHEWMIS